MFAVAEGKDPAAERKAERSKGTFEELAARYVEQHAKKHNKCLEASRDAGPQISDSTVGQAASRPTFRGPMSKTAMAAIAAPVLANQVLASASAIFSWAIREELLKDNPARQVDRHKTTSRERVLSDSEIAQFWAAFDDAGLLQGTALKMILLTGQRPGEVAACAASTSRTAGGPCPVHRCRRWAGPAPRTARRIGSGYPGRCRRCSPSWTTSGSGISARLGVTLDAAMRAICAKLGVNAKSRRTICDGPTAPPSRRWALVATR